MFVVCVVFVVYALNSSQSDDGFSYFDAFCKITTIRIRNGLASIYYKICTHYSLDQYVLCEILKIMQDYTHKNHYFPDSRSMMREEMSLVVADNRRRSSTIPPSPLSRAAAATERHRKTVGGGVLLENLPRPT